MPPSPQPRRGFHLLLTPYKLVRRQAGAAQCGVKTRLHPSQRGAMRPDFCHKATHCRPCKGASLRAAIY